MTSEQGVGGERTIAHVAQTQSRAVRLQRRLALLLVGLIGSGVLAWYYFHAVEAARAAPSAAHNSMKSALASEMKLPPLGARQRAPSGAAASSPPDASAPAVSAGVPASGAEATVAIAAPGRSPAARTSVLHDTDRRGAATESPVAMRVATVETTSSGAASPIGSLTALANLAANQSASSGGERASSAADRLADALVPTTTPAVEAQLLPTRRWLLAKGSFIDCTLETAIDSTLPGMTTCVVAVDIFGADGRVVLLERGTKLVGETHTEVRPGQARVAVLWSEARTPTGVVVALASPGTDALGRSGIPGAVDNHFGARFGAAILLSVIDGGAYSAVAHQQGSASVIYSAQGSKDIATEALRSTVAIPPTITVVPGARIQVLVARDVDFRSVYRLTRAGR